jgi:hypothetical protein
MKTKQILLTITIALLFVLFVGYGIEVFHDNPEYPRLHTIQNESECLNTKGEWQEAPKIEGEGRGFCTVSDAFQGEQANHDKIVFIVSIIVGLLAIITGIILSKAAISTGILGGGVLLILYGTLRYWQHASDILKFILLGVALAVVLWLGYKKFT